MTYQYQPTMYPRSRTYIPKDTTHHNDTRNQTFQKQIHECKILYTNANIDYTRHKKVCSTQTPAKGGLLTMIHESIYSSKNFIKNPTLPTISPYLQAFTITNILITSFLILRPIHANTPRIPTPRPRIKKPN